MIGKRWPLVTGFSILGGQRFSFVSIVIFVSTKEDRIDTKCGPATPSKDIPEIS